MVLNAPDSSDLPDSHIEKREQGPPVGQRVTKCS